MDLGSLCVEESSLIATLPMISFDELSRAVKIIKLGG
jgi:hypothetical protein